MTKDMTSGRPLGLILRFCGPMVLGNLLQQLYNMVDTAIVGQCLGPNALAGVGATGAISFLVIGFSQGCCTGFSIPAAQSFGAGDHDAMRRYVANAYYLSATVAIILTILTTTLVGPILRLMQTPDDIYPYAYDYIFMIFAGIAATILYNLLAAILRALGDSRSPIVFLAIASGLNIALDFLFMLGLDMGTRGAGLATVVAQGVSGLLCLLYLYRRYPILHFKTGETRLHLPYCGKLLRIGMPMAFQFSITAIGSIILQSSVNTLGTIAVTAVAAAQKVTNIFMSPLESLGLTMATYCGQNRGAGKIERIQKGIRNSIGISLCYCVVAVVILWSVGKYIAYLFLDPSETEILSLVVQYVRVNSALFAFLGVLFILRNGLQGMGYSLMPMLGGVVELVARTTVCLVFVPMLGYSAAIVASPTAWIAADVLLVTVYLVSMRRIKARS